MINIKWNLLRVQQQLRKCAKISLSLHASEGAFLRPSPLSTLRREAIYDNSQLSDTNNQALSPRFGGRISTTQQPKTRFLLGGSVRQQSLQYQFTTRLTALYSLLGVVATTTTRVVTTTGHHHWSPVYIHHYSNISF